MQWKSLSLAAAAIIVAAVALPVWAHHSHGNYEMDVYTPMKGTVKEMHWLNPHSWIYLEVTGEDGKKTLWALEGASPSQLRRRGWTTDMIKPGDEISVRCHKLKDGSPGCLLGYVTTKDGTERIFD